MQKKILVAAIIVVVLVIAGIGAFTLLSNDSGSDSPKFVYSNFIINKHNVLANDTVTVTIDITNEGSKAGDCEVNILIDGVISQNKTVNTLVDQKKTISFDVSSSIQANHTITIGNNSTYFNVLPRYAVGTCLIYDMTGYVDGWGQIDATVTRQVTAVTSINYSLLSTVVGFPGVPSTNTYEFSESGDNADYGNLIGYEMTTTAYGIMNLSHYQEVDGTDVTDIYVYHGVTMVISRTTDIGVMTMTLTDTNSAWIKEMA